MSRAQDLVFASFYYLLLFLLFTCLLICFLIIIIVILPLLPFCFLVFVCMVVGDFCCAVQLNWRLQSVEA